ncbi:MAG: winged helix-turn-helix domain-containing protein [Candidatus Aenigmarchaeota archaeon]|nr:winged helix-turn-helix domain-containing protein [Candidatus Aenigmarchaeota archaeon]
MDSIEFFGSKAGQVWEALREGCKTMTQIQKTSGLTSKEVSMGLGWLAKEGKVMIKNADGLYTKFELKE